MTLQRNQQARNELQRRLEVYGPHFGVTRMQGYSGIKNGWWVRLGWKGKQPAFQLLIYDQDYGSKTESEKAAMSLRDRMFVSLWQDGLIPTAIPRPVLTWRNKTGIAGMTRQKTASKTGEGHFWSWKVNWREGGTPRGRTFADSTYGGAKESYRAAALWRMETEFRTFGYSLINPEEIEALYDTHFGLNAKKSPVSVRQGEGESIDLAYMTLLDTDDFCAVRVILPTPEFNHTEDQVLRYFSVINYENDWQKTIVAARQWRDEQGKKLHGEAWQPNPTRYKPRRLSTAQSNTGILGVTIHKTPRGPYAVAQWRVGPPEARRTQRAMASIAKYGREQAIERVLKTRDEGIRQDLCAPWRNEMARLAQNAPPLERTPHGWSFWFGAQQYEFQAKEYRAIEGHSSLFWAWLDAAGTLAELQIQEQGYAGFNTRIFRSRPLALNLFEKIFAP